MAEFEKMDLASANLVAERIEQLKQLLPEVATEGGIDFDKLRLVLGDEVDEGNERYAFTWPGKTDAIRQSQTPSTATLRPCPEESVNWDETENLYIEGDNLEVLKLLQHSYHGRAKLIYIDPPYNTGHDFVYKDRFEDTIDNYVMQAGIADQSNADTSGRFHSDWCSMIYPRLKLARELLCENGIVVISIDDNEVRNLRFICDEIFGEDNFIASFVWQKRTSPDMRKIVSAAHEYLVVYAKDSDDRTCVGQIPYDENDMERYKNPDNDPNGPWISTDCTAQAGHGTAAQFYDMVTPAGRVVKLGSGLCWRYTREKMDEEIAAGHIWFGADGNGVPRKKTYLKDMTGKNAWTWLPHADVGHTQEATKELKALFDGLLPFDFPKPTRLLSRVLQIGSYKDSLVVDLFSGSASLIDAIFRINESDGGNRRFIAIQLPEQTGEKSAARAAGYETITSVGQERIRRAGAKTADEIDEANKQLRLGETPKPVPDIGFRVLKLDESGIERPKPGELLLDVVKPDRSDEDIIFEMMLRWGLELTLPIEKVNAAGYPCYSVAYGELVCCLADGLNMQALDAIADMEPRRVLMLDRILDDTTKLNAVQAFKRVEEKTGREVELRTV
jgi:adenine-specific DNA-methyltransferase